MKCLIDGCERNAITRGLCINCYQSARNSLNENRTWEDLIKLGLALPSKRNLYSRKLAEAEKSLTEVENKLARVEKKLADAKEKLAEAKKAAPKTLPGQLSLLPTLESEHPRTAEPQQSDTDIPYPPYLDLYEGIIDNSKLQGFVNNGPSNLVAEIPYDKPSKLARPYNPELDGVEVD